MIGSALAGLFWDWKGKFSPKNIIFWKQMAMAQKESPRGDHRSGLLFLEPSFLGTRYTFDSQPFGKEDVWFLAPAELRAAYKLI